MGEASCVLKWLTPRDQNFLPPNLAVWYFSLLNLAFRIAQAGTALSITETTSEHSVAYTKFLVPPTQVFQSVFEECQLSLTSILMASDNCVIQTTPPVNIDMLRSSWLESGALLPQDSLHGITALTYKNMVLSERQI